MNPLQEWQQLESRRSFLGASGLGLGGMALSGLVGAERSAGSAGNAPSTQGPMFPALAGLPHFAPKAKAVIYLHMNGGPSQLDTWDYKPGLSEWFNKDLPPSVQGGQRLTGMTSKQARFPVAPSLFNFARHGRCGRWASELVARTAAHADDIALVKTVHTNAINHDPACTFVMTGREVPGYASIGSWLSYGLGSESSELPAFVVLTPKWKSVGAAQALFTRMWSSGFLPGQYSGVALRSAGEPVLYIKNPEGVLTENRRSMLDALGELNTLRYERMGDPSIRARIAQYEMAFRMQRSVPELVDLSQEKASTLESYGPDVLQPGSFAASALLARRLIERGTRVVQILHRGWDQHGNLPSEIRLQCADTDQPVAALLADLKSRGLLESTLVVWGGEFGRTVYSQGTLTKTNYGRDHHPRNFCMWMAGGGIRGGTVLGKTDDFSYNVAETPVHLNDLNATILHLCGIDHERFTFKFQGLDARLTGVERQRVLREILA
jgi:uncharacterized protein (DUF1501 family)